MDILHKLSRLEYIQNYIIGGKADFVLYDRIEDIHLNYLVNQDKNDKTLFYVRYKSNTQIVIGTIKINETKIGEDTYNIPTFTPKKYLQREYIFKTEVFRKIILYIYYINKLPSNIEFLYSGICSICGRKLTNPKYIEIGIGEVCLNNSVS